MLGALLRAPIVDLARQPGLNVSPTMKRRRCENGPTSPQRCAEIAE